MIPRLAKRAANAAGKGIILKYLEFLTYKILQIESCLRFDAKSQLKLRLVLAQVINYK